MTRSRTLPAGDIFRAPLILMLAEDMIRAEEIDADSPETLPAAASFQHGRDHRDSGDWPAIEEEGWQTIARSRELLEHLHEEDRVEVIDLHEEIEAAVARRDAAALKQTMDELRELLFFVEGRVEGRV